MVSSFLFAYLLYLMLLKEVIEMFWLRFLNILKFGEILNVLWSGAVVFDSKGDTFVNNNRIFSFMSVDPKTIVLYFTN